MQRPPSGRREVAIRAVLDGLAEPAWVVAGAIERGRLRCTLPAGVYVIELLEDAGQGWARAAPKPTERTVRLRVLADGTCEPGELRFE